MNKAKRLLGLGLTLALSVGVTFCGKSSSPQTAPIILPPIQQALTTTSTTQRIPADILASVLFKESGLSGAPTGSLYGPTNTAIGPKLGETAMGLPRDTLGLDASMENDSIAVQMTAYGKWVRGKLDEAHLDLPVSLARADDVYDWIWQLARMHYPDATSPKNLQILFAMELLKTLNQGFIWQDPNSSERLELPARVPAIQITDFSDTVQANLLFDSRVSDILAADYLQLTYYNETSVLNRPRRIEVIHCPYTVSNCLANQLDPTNPAPLQAHYVIPADYSVLPRPVKILPHSTPVRRLNEDGQIQTTTDAIVIMLVGNSGRYVEGERTQVNPNWYTKEQLSDLGKVIIGLCQALPRENPVVTTETCSTIGTGIQFSDASRHKRFQLGDIPDYEASIFESVVRNPSNINGAVSAKLPANTKTFASGSPISVEFTFIKGTSRLEIQRLERCVSGKTVWVPINTQYLRSVDRKSVDITLYDDGPNKNGQQFIRAMAYAADGSFMNWSNTSFFLSGFDRATAASNSAQCLD
ncbi:MAG: hypothetical protein EOP10_08145 [Proteobacteria bacterium]|nr:MAG: hypothetical protein EOP10_08145 [Pseudomonadota bacterium]